MRIIQWTVWTNFLLSPVLCAKVAFHQLEHTGVRRDALIPLSNTSLPIFRKPLSHSSSSGHSLDNRQLLKSNARQYMHAVSINLGGVDVQLFLDTGSSNIWLIGKDYQCIDGNGKPIDNSNCQFAGSSFDPSIASGAKIDGSFFNTGYSGGEYVIGYGWKSNAVLNGVTIPNQVFGVVEQASWAGDGFTSGLFGLGSLYTNQIYRNDSSSPQPGDDNRLVAPNPMTLAWEEGLSSEYHTLALNRVPFDSEHDGVQPAGYLTFGGRPADITVTGKSVTIPLIPFTVGAVGAMINEQALSVPNVPSTFTFPGSANITQIPVYPGMDTGASGVGLPSAVWNAYTSQITSHACDGSGLPDLAWHVAGVDLPFDKRDLLGYSGPGDCFFNAYDAGDSGAALGPNFAQNTVWSWNKRTAEVTIMEREPY